MEEPYEPKNIMITGGAGFIASHVVLLLTKKYPQFNIVNFDRLDCKWRDYDRKWLHGLHARVLVCLLDLSQALT